MAERSEAGGIWTSEEVKVNSEEETKGSVTHCPPCLKGGAPVRKLGRGDMHENSSRTEVFISPSHARKLARQPPLGKGAIRRRDLDADGTRGRVD